ELVLLVRAGLAGAESKRTSERVRAYMGNSAAKGTHFGRVPYGYRAIKTVLPLAPGQSTASIDVSWEQDPSEAAVVREMARLAVEENLGFKGIADALEEKGYRTRERRPWSGASIRHILTNEATCGT